MKLVQSIHIDRYFSENERESQSFLPYLIGSLIKNTIKGVKGIDIPDNDNIQQTGLDGIVEFEGCNKYLGESKVYIEIGTSKNYLKKANSDIGKRTANKDITYVYVTPHRWLSRKENKQKWIDEKKKKYGWKDIRIIDAEILEKWLEEDITTSKIFLQRLDIKTRDIYSIEEKEKELQNKTTKALGLDFFDYNDKDYENFINSLEKNNYRIKAPTREEGLYVTLYYLKKTNKEKRTLIIENEKNWEDIVKNKIVENSILIPYFYHEDSLEIPQNNTILSFYESDEIVENINYEIKSRTIDNLREKLNDYYKDDNESYEIISSFIRKSLGKYMPLKRLIFKDYIKPEWCSEENIEIAKLLFLINSFNEKEVDIFKNFEVDITAFKRTLRRMISQKDPCIIYYKYWKQYNVVNVYNLIEWIGPELDEEIITKYCKIAKEVLLYIDPRYNDSNIHQKYYIDEPDKHIYSRTLKQGIIRSLIILKLYFKKEGKYTLNYKIDKVVKEYYDSLETEADYLNFAYYADKYVEYDFELYGTLIKNSIKNENFQKMFNMKDKELLFGGDEYCKVLWGIEKMLSKKDFAAEGIELLFLLCQITKNIKENIGNNPMISLKHAFLGYDNMTALEKNEKISVLKAMIDKYPDQAKQLLTNIFPSSHTYWTEFPKLEYDIPDEIKSIKYISEQKEYFEEYYKLYVNNFVEQIEDLIPIYEEMHFISFDCYEEIKNKTIALLKNSSDEDKFKIKEKINKRIRGFEKYHNNAWYLSEKELKCLDELRQNIKYDNQVYDYIYIYGHFQEKSEDKESHKRMLEILKEDSKSIKICLNKAENKHRCIEDIIVHIHNKKYNIDFIKMILEEYNNKDKSIYSIYLSTIYKYVQIEDIIELYNKLKDISINSRVFILANFGYNKKLYEQIKNATEEQYYWNEINIYNSDDSIFVFDKCLEFKNFKACLALIYDKKEYYDRKIKILNDIKNSVYEIEQLEHYYINEIFKSFEKCKEYEEEISILEIYYSPILDNKIHFFSKRASQYPEIVAELVQLLYKDEEGNSEDIPNIEKIAANCYDILRIINIDFEQENYLKWCEDFTILTTKSKRTNVNMHVLGSLLARGQADKKDGIYPSRHVREIIEKYKSPELERSFIIEKHNQRGVHYVGEGEEELALYEEYINYSERIDAIEFPRTKKMLRKIALEYKEEAKVLNEEARYVQ